MGSARTHGKAKLDEFWQKSEGFALVHGGRFEPAPETDWRVREFPDDVLLERADPVSIGRLTDSWGWSFKGPGWGNSGVPHWCFPITVGGTDLWVSEDWAPESRIEDRFLIRRFDSPQGSVTIDVGKGVRAGDLRRRIEAFAHAAPKPI